jgi:membrane protease YdiL (CAAX protease family)
LPEIMRTTLTNTLIFTAIFFLLTALGHTDQSFISLMALMGLAFPLLYAWQTDSWTEMGFTRHNTLPALVWGLAAGLVSALVGLWVVGRWAMAENWGMELLVGLPLWALLAVPFQEFFFRAYLQTRLGNLFGKTTGLLVTLVVFTAWHTVLPIFGPGSGSDYRLDTWPGLSGTLLAAILYGYVFQRTGNILAPWLAHTIAGVAFLLVGAASMVREVL